MALILMKRTSAMAKIRFGLISGFRLQSILVKTLVVLFILIALTISSVYLLFRNMVTERYREETIAAQHLLLSKISNSVDTAILRVNRNMNRLFTNQNVTGLMISPARYDYDRLVDVMDSLFQLAKQDALIRQSSLYVFGNDMVYSSDGEIGTILDSRDKDAIISCLTATDEINVFNLENRSVGLLESDGRLFLFQRYPSVMANGLLVVELNTQHFRQEAVEFGNRDRYVVQVYDQNFRPLFPKQEPMGAIPMGADEFHSVVQEDETVYAYRSEISGLTVLTQIHASELMPSIQSTVSVAFPYLIVMVLLIVLFAFYLIWTTYKPVQDVVYSMAASGYKKKTDATRNEFEIIRTTYQSSERKNQMLSELLSEVAPAVTERAFQSLLSEAPPEESAIGSILQSVSSPFQMDARYMVIFLQLSADPKRESFLLDAEINNIWFLNLCQNYWEKRAQSYFLLLPFQVCVGILSFGGEVTKSKTKLLVADFETIIAEQTKNLRYTWDMGVGQLHVGIMEVRASYLEAREDLNRRLYYREERGAPGSSRRGDAPDTAYYTGRIRQMLGFAVDGKMDAAVAGLSVLKEALDLQKEGGGEYRVFRDIQNVVAEEMIRYHIDLAQQNLLQPARPLDRTADAAAMLEETDALCREAFQLLAAAGRKGRNKHVDSAKKYIADNYAGTTLSLDEVSSHVGISGSYLSRIFAESLGCGFLDYLNQFRIEKARQLLLATDLQIAEIGYQVGFNSSQSFTRVFKKIMEITPSVYRESMRSMSK